MIVCSDHSQSQVEQEIDLFRAFDGFAVLPASHARRSAAPRGRDRASARPRARRRSTCSTATAAPSSSARAERTLLELEGVDLVMRMTDHPDGEAAVRGKRGDDGQGAALRAARRPARRRAGERWSVEGDLDLLALSARDGPRRLRDLPRRARPRLVGAALPHLGRAARLRRARLRVPRLGRRAPRRRRVARLAARQRLARLADLVRDRPGRRRAASSGRCATSCR